MGRWIPIKPKIILSGDVEEVAREAYGGQTGTSRLVHLGAMAVKPISTFNRTTLVRKLFILLSCLQREWLWTAYLGT